MAYCTIQTFKLISLACAKIVNSDEFEKYGYVIHNADINVKNRYSQLSIYYPKRNHSWQITINFTHDWDKSPDPRIIQCIFNNSIHYWSGYDIEDKTGDELIGDIMQYRDKRYDTNFAV